MSVREKQAGVRAKATMTARLLTTTLLATGMISAALQPAMAQSVTGTLTQVVNGTAQTASGISLNGSDGSGYEVLSGSVTVDGQGGSFSGFNTVGGDGSGGGAGLGGAFFVNEGAALVIRNANFLDNRAVGGTGGGGGSVEASNAALAIGDKKATTSTNLVSGYGYDIVQSGGTFTLNSVTFEDNDPVFAVRDGVTFGAATAGPGGTVATTSTALVTNASDAGFSFDGGLDVSDSISTSMIFDSDSWVAGTMGAMYFYENSNVRIGTENLSVADRNALQEGLQIVGNGVPAGTFIESVVEDGDGNVSEIILNQDVDPGAMGSTFNIFSPPLLVGSVFSQSGNILNFGEDNVPPSYEVGMRVSGDGISGNVTITDIDASTGVVTLSSAVPGDLLSLSALKPGYELNSNVVYAPSSSHGLSVGDAVYGDGIPAGTTVTAIAGDRLTLSNAITGEMDVLYSSNVVANGSTLTIGSGVVGVEVGQIVEGDNVAPGTVVQSVNPVTGQVTLNKALTGAPLGLRFVSESAMGGGMNGRQAGDNVAVAAGGPDGALPLDGEGVAGGYGLDGASSTSGFGAIGGSGGDGSNGLATDPTLVADIAATGASIAAAIADAVASSVPDPYPDPSNAASSTANAIALGITLANQTAQLVNWQIGSAEGTLGRGGDGGRGGEGGDGGDFFGGGSGGAGGAGGTSAGNDTFGNGTGGDGGAGGNGGFGGGGGGGGQPGTTIQSAAGGGGYGGFGAGDGSTVDGSGNTLFGEGGSGFGGAIFVRAGGSVVLEGEMVFAGNSARGGSSGDIDGSSGEGAGSDMFIMRGADVTIAPDAGKEIIFEGGIADDAQASYENAQHAEGYGADVTINGEGRVLFLGENTYTGQTIIENGTLVAEDGVGLHDSSQLVFAGGGSGDLDALNVAVFQTAGEFTRWVGADSDRVMWTGSGGFASETESGLVLAFGQSSLGTRTLTWNQGGFVPDGSSFVLGSVSAQGTVTLVNDVQHSDTTSGVVSFYLVDNVNTQTDGAILQGDITAGVLDIDANSVLAEVEIQGDVDARDMNVLGGHATTTGAGELASDLILTVSEGAAFTAERVDSFDTLNNEGTATLDAQLTMVTLDNEGRLNVNEDLAVTEDASNRDGGVVNMDAEIDVTGRFLNNGTLNVTGERTLTAGELYGTSTGRIVMADAEDEFTADLSGGSEFYGQMSGLGSFVKEGDGTLNLFGANSYTGGTTVADGTLVIGARNGSTGSLADTGAVDVLQGATLSFEVSDTVGVLTNGGILNTYEDLTVASLDNEATGVFNMQADLTSAGDVNNDGTVNLGGDHRIDITGAEAGLTGEGTFDLDQFALTVDQLGDTTFAGTMSGTGSFAKEGEGVLTFTGAHSYTGGTLVHEGTLDTTGGGTLADEGNILINEDGTFVAGTVDTVASVVNVGVYDVNAAQTVDSLGNTGTTNLEAKLTAGYVHVDPDDLDSDIYGVVNGVPGIINQNADISSEGKVINNGLIEVTGERRIDITGLGQGFTGTTDGEVRLTGAETELTIDQLGNSTYSGTITGAGGFTKEGTGWLTFSNALTFTGGTTVSEGWVEIKATGSLADTGAITVGENGTFLTRAEDTVGEVSNSGRYLVDANAAQNVTSFTNTGTGYADFNSDLTARTGGVTNEEDGVIDLQANVLSEGDVTNDGELNITGVRRIETTGATSGFAGASTGVVNLATLGDVLTADQLGDTTYAGVIDGLGAFVKQGEGVLTFTGANTYTGGTYVEEGTLDTTGGGTLADSGWITIETGAEFVAGTVDTVADVTNRGTYSVDAAQTVDTVYNEGTVNLEAKLTAGRGSADYGVGNTSLGTINMNADIESAGHVVNSGLMVVTGDRRIDVTDADTGFSGGATGEVRLTDAADALTVDQLGDTTYAGTITGAGSFAKEGDGTLNLTGTSTFTGGTTVTEGTLSTTGGGQLADTGAIDVKSGATFYAGTADTVGEVTNAGTYTVATAQNVTELTNTGLTELDANLTARTEGVTNEVDGTIEMAANIESAGDVVNDGQITVTGVRLIETTGATSGFAGAGTGVVTLAAEADGLVVDQLGDTTYAGFIEGAGAFRKLGEGVLTFTGANTYTGGTWVTEGTLDTTGGGTLADTGDVTIAQGAEFVAGTADTVADVINSGTYTVDAAQTVDRLLNQGEVNLEAKLTAGRGEGGYGVGNTQNGTINLNADIESAGNVINDGLLVVTGEHRIETTDADTGFTGTSMGKVQLSDADDKLIVEQLGNTVYAGIITGDGAFDKDGSGALTLSGDSTYTGGTTVLDGILNVTGTLADAGDIEIRSGAEFRAASEDTVGDVTNAGTYWVQEEQTVASLTNSGTTDVDNLLFVGEDGVTNEEDGTIEMGANITSEGGVENDGEITLDGSGTLAMTGTDAGLTGTGTFTLSLSGELGIDQAGDTTYDGTMTGGATLWKFGAGDLTFGGTTGAIDMATLHVVQGELTLETGGVLRSDADLTLYGTEFEVLAGAQTLNSLDGAGTVTLNGSDLTLDGESDFEGDIVDAGALTVNDAFEYAGQMDGDSLTLDGPAFTLYSLSSADFRTADFTNGTITLYGPMSSVTPGGLTVTEDLNVTGDTNLHLAGSLDPSLATITTETFTLSGANVLLSGNGYIDAALTVIENGATVSPGNSPGYLVFSGDADFRNGGVAEIEIGGTEPGTGYDVIEVGGELLLDDTSVLNVDPFGGFEPQEGEVYQILRFDPELRTGEFGLFNNNTSLNFAYFNNVGILVALGDSGGDVSEQLVENIIETTPGSDDENEEMFNVVRQLGDPDEGLVGQNNGVVGGGGGYLLPMLAAADPEERIEVFSRFTPEGYGGALEYAFRSLMVTSSLFDGAPTSGGQLSWGSLVHDNRSLASESSDTLSDYETSFAATGARFGYAGDMVSVGFGVQTVNGSFSVDSGLHGSGDGTQFQVGAMLTGLNSNVAPYITVESGTHDLSGTRNALTSTTAFDDVESSARLVRIGARYSGQMGAGVLNIDASAMAGEVDGLSFSETQGVLPDRLDVTIPDQSVAGVSFGMNYSLPVADKLTLSAGLEIDHVAGLNDYVIEGRSGGDSVTFSTEVPGVASTQGALSFGVGFEATEGVNLNLTGYADGTLGGKSNAGASVSLNVQF